MATSGQVKTYEVDGGTYFYVNWQQASQSTSGNYTDINWQLNIHCRWNYYSNALRSNGVNINGGNVYGGATYSNLGQGDHQLASGSLRIYHNADGTKSFNINTSGWVIDGGDTSGSGDFTLNTIPRYAVTNSASGSNVEENFSVSYTKYVTSYKYKLRISIPGVRALERINYNTSGVSFKLSQSTIDDLFNTYGANATFNLGFAVETYDSSGNNKISNGNEKIISCKTDSKGRIRINGEWKNATLYVRVNGSWKKATPYIRMNNEWKRGK